MLVHRCDRCCVYKKEIQPCRTKYRGIWAILMHKMMFPSESCNSVSNGTFCEFRPFSVIAEIFSPRTPWTTLRTPVWEPMGYINVTRKGSMHAGSVNKHPASVSFSLQYEQKCRDEYSSPLTFSTLYKIQPLITWQECEKKVIFFLFSITVI